MNIQCEFCWTNFKTVKYLEHHQKVAKYCQIYKYVLFTCRKCNFCTRGIRNIDMHVKNCKSTNVISNDPMSDMQKKIIELEEELVAYKAKLSKVKVTTDDNNKLKKRVELESFKNKILRHIIEKNVNIRVDDVLVENEDGLHVYNIKGGNIPVFIHENLKEEKGVEIVNQTVISIKEKKEHTVKPKAKKKVFKPITNENIHCDVIQSYPKITEINEKISGDDFEFRMKEMGDIFDKIRTNRNYTKLLNDLQSIRYNILSHIEINEYQKILNNHVRDLEDIFKLKNYDTKKITSIITKGLTPIEGRIISYGNYTQQHLDVDDIQKLNNTLDLFIDKNDSYEPFNPKKFFNKFCNYGVALFTIKQNIERYIVNYHGKHNVVYVPLSKNTDKDPFSFYTLEKVTRQTRSWVMDCRLENLTNNFVSNVLPYMISTFRRLYRDVFGDNDFRENYTQFCQITECDCEQLLQNILVLGDIKVIRNLFRNTVKNICMFAPTEHDKFNLKCDDAIQRKRLQKKEDVDLVVLVKQLFDGISSEEAVDFYRKRI